MFYQALDGSRRAMALNQTKCRRTMFCQTSDGAKALIRCLPLMLLGASLVKHFPDATEIEIRFSRKLLSYDEHNAKSDTDSFNGESPNASRCSTPTPNSDGDNGPDPESPRASTAASSSTCFSQTLNKLYCTRAVQTIKGYCIRNFVAKYRSPEDETGEMFPYKESMTFMSHFKQFKVDFPKQAQLAEEFNNDHKEQVRKDVGRNLEGEPDKDQLQIPLEKILLSYGEIMYREYVCFLANTLYDSEHSGDKRKLPKYKQEDCFVLITLLRCFLSANGKLYSLDLKKAFWMSLCFMAKRKESDEDIFPASKQQREIGDIDMSDPRRSKHIVLNMIKRCKLIGCEELADSLWETMIKPDEQYEGAQHGGGPAFRIIGTLVTQLSGNCFNDPRNMLKTSNAMKVKLFSYIYGKIVNGKKLHQVTLSMVASYLIWHWKKAYKSNTAEFMASMTKDDVRVTTYEFSPVDDSFLDTLDDVFATSEPAYKAAIYQREVYDSFITKRTSQKHLKKVKEVSSYTMEPMTCPLLGETEVVEEMESQAWAAKMKAAFTQIPPEEIEKSKRGLEIYEWDPWCSTHLTRWSSPKLEEIFGKDL